MKKLTLTITIAAVLGAVFLVLAFPAVSAAGPEPVTFDLYMCYINPSLGAFGNFVANGAVTDSGFSEDMFYKPSGTLRGVTTLGGQSGTIIMKFNARVIPVSVTEEQWIGHFVIDSGTGAYEGLNGQGSIEMILTDTACTPGGPYNLTGTYSGVAQ